MTLRAIGGDQSPLKRHEVDKAFKAAMGNARNAFAEAIRAMGDIRLQGIWSTGGLTAHQVRAMRTATKAFVAAATTFDSSIADAIDAIDRLDTKETTND